MAGNGGNSQPNGPNWTRSGLAKPGRTPWLTVKQMASEQHGQSNGKKKRTKLVRGGHRLLQYSSRSTLSAALFVLLLHELQPTTATITSVTLHTHTRTTFCGLQERRCCKQEEGNKVGNYCFGSCGQHFKLLNLKATRKKQKVTRQCGNLCKN